MKFCRYQTKETIVREQIRPSSDGAFDDTLPFLDFVICPAYQFAYKHDVLQDYGLDKVKFRNDGHFVPRTNKSTGLDPKKFFNIITHDPNEILQKVKITTKDRDQRTFLQTFDGTNSTTEHLDVSTKYQNNLGRCFSIRPKNHVVKLEVIKIDITASMDIYVYIGYPGQFMYNTKERVIEEYFLLS